MVHPRGFEPLTARFVAEYSIQLSYGCIILLMQTPIHLVSLKLGTLYESALASIPIT